MKTLLCFITTSFLLVLHSIASVHAETPGTELEVVVRGNYVNLSPVHVSVKTPSGREVGYTDTIERSGETATFSGSDFSVGDGEVSSKIYIVNIESGGSAGVQGESYIYLGSNDKKKIETSYDGLPRFDLETAEKLTSYAVSAGSEGDILGATNYLIGSVAEAESELRKSVSVESQKLFSLSRALDEAEANLVDLLPEVPASIIESLNDELSAAETDEQKSAILRRYGESVPEGYPNTDRAGEVLLELAGLHTEVGVIERRVESGRRALSMTNEKEKADGSGNESSQAPVVPETAVQPVSYTEPFDIAPDTFFTISLDAGYGQRDQGDIEIPVRIESGGVFQRAINVDTGWEDVYTFDGRFEFGLDPSVIYTPEYKVRKRAAFTFGYMSSDSRGSIDFLRGGNAEPFLDGSALLDPGGLEGDLGGGGIKLVDNDIGFADHHDVRVRSDFKAWDVGFEVSNSYRFGDFQMRPWGGVFYRNTDEDVTISGITGNGLVDYSYDNGVGSDQFGGEFRLETKYRITDDARFFVTPRVALSRVWADASSRVQVNVDGEPFASSSESSIDGAFTNFEYEIAGGIEYNILDSLSLTLGANWGSSESPTLKYAPERRANIASRRDDTWTVTASARWNF
jgi:hypothetical protein